MAEAQNKTRETAVDPEQILGPVRIGIVGHDPGQGDERTQSEPGHQTTTQSVDPGPAEHMTHHPRHDQHRNR